MKKFASAFILTAVLVIFGVTPGSLAAQIAKPGAACSKAGLTQTIAGKKYTCVKSGKKLLWNKGVSLAPKPVVTPAAPVITLDKLDATWTLKVALSNVSKKIESLPSSTFKAEMIYSPTVREDEKAIEEKLLVPSTRAFQEYFQPAKYQVVVFTNEDGVWADQALLNYGGTYPFKLSDDIAKWSTAGRYCNFAFATKSSTGVPIYYECTDTRKTRAEGNYQNPPHEYFHLVQFHISPRPMPAWLVEGSASFMGAAIGFSGLANPAASKTSFDINTGYDFDPDGKGFDPNRFRTWLKSATDSEVKKVFKYLESTNLSNSDGNKHAYYSLGSIATEALVATYGFDGFMKIWLELSKGIAFADAFKNAFGLSPDEFYVKLTPYLRTK